MATAVITRLRELGYAVLPAPRAVDVDGRRATVDGTWSLAARGVAADDIAVRTLTGGLAAEHGLSLKVGDAPRRITLAVQPGAVPTDTAGVCDAQAYRLSVAEGAIEIVANARPGLFYGVQTLLQLLDGDGRRRLTAPVGTISDWPQWPLRIIHWDTKHHQDRIETLRRLLDWTARFKCNAVCIEIEDKFEYPSHPVIGAPGAFTTAELQGLVDYALERHIQIIPNVQAPAHLCYVLKHPEFAHLRCDGSNYQICMDEPEARRLLFDMYDDLCEATKGVEYFHVSTDEVYYAGICEKFRKPYNPLNRSLTWVDYVQAAHEHLAAKGRRIIVWAEFPLLPEHVSMLPSDIVNGIYGRNEKLNGAAKRNGMQVLAYHPIQGAEKLFPGYFASTDSPGRPPEGRLQQAFDATCRKRTDRADVLGTFCAAWDDSGLHGETFWLGWATMAQYGWQPEGASVHQTAADFMDVYYGRGAGEMLEAYRELQSQAAFWEASWERLPSKVRGTIYGYSEAKKPIQLKDVTLLPPALPALRSPGAAGGCGGAVSDTEKVSDTQAGPVPTLRRRAEGVSDTFSDAPPQTPAAPPELAVEPVFATRYKAVLAELPARLAESDRLLGRLHAAVGRATRNRYGIEVLISIANLIRHHLRMLGTLAEAEGLLARAAESARSGEPTEAVARMVDARRRVGGTLEDLHATFAAVAATWQKSRFPKNRTVGGREFLHVYDDVKDHFADRRADLTYMIAPAESIGLAAWRAELGEIIAQYAAAHGVAVAGPGEQLMDD